MYRFRSWGYAAGVLACALVLLLGALSAAAQDTPPTLQTASLSLWPEYDDPGLLVIFAGDFTGQTGFPRDISISLPAGARNVQAAYPAASGGLLKADSEISEGTLTFKQLPVPSFHAEYYVDRQPSGNLREIVHVFRAPFAIATLQVAVQQPARATDFTMSPAAESSETRDDGLTYYVFRRSNLAAGDTLEITLRYAKADSGVSRPQLAVPNSAPTPLVASAPAAAPRAAGVGAWLPWVLIGLGATALAALLTYWVLSQRPPRRQRPVPDAAARKVASPTPPGVGTPQGIGAPPPASAANFCTQCGHPLARDDRFCPQCGTSRRG